MTDRLKEIVYNTFQFKDSRKLSKITAFGHEWTYFVQDETKDNKSYTENDVICMLEFLIESIFVGFGGKICQQSVGILMGIYCTPSMSIFSFTRIRSSLCKNTEAKAFNLTFRYIQSINKPNFTNWIPFIYLNELEIKETTEKASSVSIVYLKSHNLIA